MAKPLPDMSWYRPGSLAAPPETEAPPRRGVRWLLCLKVAVALCLITGPLLAFWLLRTGPAAPVSRWQASTMSAFRTYMKLEGDASRGKRFEALAGCYELWLMNGGPRSEDRMMALLGPPDRAAPLAGGGRMYAYQYDRFKKKDWAFYVTVVNGRVTAPGWNGCSVNKTSMWPRFAPPAPPKPGSGGPKPGSGRAEGTQDGGS